MKYIILLSIFILVIKCWVIDTQDLKCLTSQTHKNEPTREENLFGQCNNWKELSCCHFNASENLHLTDTPWNGFNYNHCYRISSKCKRRLIQELCMYECDPYLGKFIVQDTSKKMRSERYFKIPLCQRDCDAWFEDCKFDYTCRDNWNKGFKWVNGINYCREQDKCTTIKDKFKTAQNFCNKIWDDAFEVTNSTNCFTFEFQDPLNNPNKEAAKFYNN